MLSLTIKRLEHYWFKVCTGGMQLREKPISMAETKRGLEHSLTCRANPGLRNGAKKGQGGVLVEIQNK